MKLIENATRSRRTKQKTEKGNFINKIKKENMPKFVTPKLKYTANRQNGK